MSVVRPPLPGFNQYLARGKCDLLKAKKKNERRPAGARTRDPLVRNPRACPLHQSAPSDDWMKNESLFLKLQKKLVWKED